ncbi:ABC transporter permease [Paracoccus aminophilus]|nr:ABC transporter permease [Paracoccus aminophilus]
MSAVTPPPIPATTRALPAGFLRVLRREIRQIRRRPALVMMLGPYPLILFVLLASIFHAGLPTGLPVAVVDLDGSTLSRQIVQMLDATPELEIAARLPNLTEAKAELVANRVYGIVLIPQHAERDLLAGAHPEIAVFSNSQMMTVGGIVARGAAGALSTFSAGVSVQLYQANGLSAEAALAAVNPIPVQQSALFNPALAYTEFLLAAVMPTVLQIFICATAVMAVGRDAHSRAGMARLVRLGGSPLRALAGKLLPYAAAFLGCLWLADAIIFGYFGAPFRGSLALHLTYSLLYVVTCLGLGTMLALLVEETVAGLGMAGLLASPAFGFAGISFPRDMMNGFAQAWGAILPLTPYLHLRTDQVVRGTPVAQSLPALGWMLALALIYGGIAWLLAGKRARALPPLDAERAEVTA